MPIDLPPAIIRPHAYKVPENSGMKKEELDKFLDFGQQFISIVAVYIQSKN